MNPFSDFETDFPLITGQDISAWQTFELASFTRSPEQAFRGLSSGKAVPDGTHSDASVSMMALAGPGLAEYSFSAWLLAPNGGLEARLILTHRLSNLTTIPPSGSSFLTAYTSVSSTDWTRLTISGATHARTGAVVISVQFRRIDLGTLQAADVLYVDEAEVGAQGQAFDTSETFDVLIGGEVMSVSAIGAMTSSGLQQFTAARSVNGIIKSHAAGTDVRLYPSPRMAL
jgi:hypothetical protein